MSWKDKLSKAQESGSSIPKLDITLKFDMKQEEGKGNIAFRYWHSEDKVNKYYPSPIDGVLIGSAFRCSAFDQSFGSKGGSYTSALYLNNANITMFSPSSGGKSDRFSGTKEEVENWLVTRGVGDKLSVKKCLLVLRESGLVEIQTNTSIAIEQLNNLGNEFAENVIVLTPALYNPDDASLSKKCKQFLGPFAPTNPPKYASVSVGGPITDDIAERYQLERYIDDFEVWKKWTTNNQAEDESPVNTVTDETVSEVGTVYKTKDPVNVPAAMQEPIVPNSPVDDLPF